MKLSPAFAVGLACLVVAGSVGMADCQTWTAMKTAPSVSVGAMLLLTDGRVLVHEEPNCSGGSKSGCVGKDYTAWFTLTPDKTGSYINGTWTQVASLPSDYAPLFFASAVLPDGKVVIQGGEYNCPGGSCTGDWQSLGALYDPAANTWTATTPPVPDSSETMGDAESVVLPNGTWMVAACCAEIGGISTYPLYFYFDESTLSFTTEANAGDGTADDFDEEGWNLLPNGQVLTVDAYVGSYNAAGMNSELYNPSTNMWTSAGSTLVQLWDSGCGTSSNASYEVGPGVLMPNGTVFYTGGNSCGVGNIATYNWSTETWTAQSPFPNKDAANDAPASIETNGNAIVMASPYTNTFSKPSTFYEWNGTTLSTFPNPANASKDASYLGHLLVLPTGQILFTDFTTTGIEVLTTAGTYQSAWQPTITTAPSILTLGQTYSISGTQFNGVSTGASYGDDFQDATNYPLVRIVNNGTGDVFYAKTHGHSTMGVATGTTLVSTNFDVPAGMETGPCELYVVANGIPSAASACNVGAATPGIYSPVNDSTLTGTSATFQWNAYTGASAYWVDIGSTQGGNNYYSSGSLSTSTTSVTASTLPSNGSTVWARWYYLLSGTWQYIDYSYTALGGSSSKGVITTPAQGSTLTSSTITFDWTAGAGATAYWLDIGSSTGGNNYYSSGNLGNTLTATANGLPTNDSTVYATLYSLVGGVWLSNAYTYTAFNAAGAGGMLTTPTPGSTLTSSTVTFDWTAGASATAYWMDIGSSAGGNNYYSSGNLGNVLTTTVNGLPTDDVEIFVTLYSLIGNQWVGNAYTYTENANSGLAAMQTPTPGSMLSGTTATFTWSADANATAYWVDIGSSAGGNNYYSSGNLGNVLTTTVYTLPANSTEIFVSLYSYVGGQWLNNPVTYTSGP